MYSPEEISIIDSISFLDTKLNEKQNYLPVKDYNHVRFTYSRMLVIAFFQFCTYIYCFKKRNKAKCKNIAKKKRTKVYSFYLHLFHLK